MTTGRAVLIGHLRVTLPVLAIIAAGMVIGAELGATKLGALAGAALAWVAWSTLVPRWRDWVVASGIPIPPVERLAVRTGLIWPRGSVVARTELRRRNGERGW